MVATASEPTETLHAQTLFRGGAVLGGVHEMTGVVEPHGHDFLEIAVVGAGRGRHLASAGERWLRHGDVVVLRPGAWHGFVDCRDLVVANCCISATALRDELAWLREISRVQRLLWRDPVTAGAHGVRVTRVEPGEADEAIAEISRLERDLASPVRRHHRVLGRLLAVVGTIADGQGPDPDHVRRAVPEAVAAVVARLEDNPSHPWMLDELAKSVSLDPAYLSRLFRRYVGLPPLAFLARVRAERAASLLACSTLPVARVGVAVGWGEPTYFARRFRALVGLTPTEYRRRSGMAESGRESDSTRRS